MNKKDKEIKRLKNKIKALEKTSNDDRNVGELTEEAAYFGERGFGDLTEMDSLFRDKIKKMKVVDKRDRKMKEKPKIRKKKSNAMKAEQVIAKKNELIQELYMKIDELQIIIKALEDELASLKR